jgi:hypothetical protein
MCFAAPRGQLNQIDVLFPLHREDVLHVDTPERTKK